MKGFDKYLGEDAVRQQLTEAFAECGTVNNVRLPSDRESGELKGIGFIEFGSVDAKVCLSSSFLGFCMSFICLFESFVFRSLELCRGDFFAQLRQSVLIVFVVVGAASSWLRAVLACIQHSALKGL